MVMDNVDPENRGRLMLQIPDVLGDSPSSWALPCFPFTGIQSGCFVVPGVGSPVWVEFEHGDPDKPIWVGCWYQSLSDLPTQAKATPPAVQAFVLQTLLNTLLMVSDLPGPTGGILLQTPAAAMISVSDTGITISNGQGASISMVGPTVTINNGALVVT
jgi:hypothetical protein